jgi:hypothetical protein
MHEPFVAGDVDKAEHVAVIQRRIGVAELDGDATSLLLLEAIGVYALRARTSVVLPWSM